jgi:hypothetical protein
MKIGNIHLGTRLTDVSGSVLTGITSASQWAVYTDVGGVTGNSLVSVRNISEPGFGLAWYDLTVNVGTAGQGWAIIKSTISGAVATPNFYNLDLTNHDSDEIYSQVTLSQVAGIQTTLQFNDSIVVSQFKQGDAASFSYTPPDSILVSVAGTSGYLMQLRSSDAATTSGSSTLLGTCTVTVPVTGKTFGIVVPSALTDNIIREGKTKETVYGDLSCHVAAGDLKKTICEFIFTVTRQYTKD